MCLPEKRFPKNPEDTMKTKNLYIFLAIVLSVFSASAQQAKKVYFGGNLGFSFGSETSVMVEPTVLYGFSQYFKLGGGVSYCYFPPTGMTIRTTYTVRAQ